MFEKQQQEKQYHGLWEEQKLNGKSKQKKEFEMRKNILRRTPQAYKTMTLRDMYLFTVADSGKVLEHFMLVARFEHRVFPLAQIWCSGVRLLLEPAYLFTQCNPFCVV